MKKSNEKEILGLGTIELESKSEKPINENPCKWGEKGVVWSSIVEDDYLPEYREYKPHPDSLSKLRKALKIIEINGERGYCTEEQLLTLIRVNDDGKVEIIDDVRKLVNRLNTKYLRDIELLLVNPENNKEFLPIEYPEDFESFLRQISFYIHKPKNLKNIDKRKQKRLAKEQNEKLGNLLTSQTPTSQQNTQEINDVPDVVSESSNKDADIYEKTLTVQQEILTTLENERDDVKKDIIRLSKAIENLNIIVSELNNRNTLD